MNTLLKQLAFISDKFRRSRMGTKQSRRHRGAVVGLAPQTKLQAPQNWNVKHYKWVEFWLIL